MKIHETLGWDDYELIDSGEGRRLERFGKYILSRPDPQAIWLKKTSENEWEKADAVFDEKWIKKGNMPDKWGVKYKNLKFWAKLSPFKHTGIFPEQIIHWNYMADKIGGLKSTPSILNLFGYTGISSLICANSGAKVTHVDASYPAMTWFKENQILSGLNDKPIRLIVDDALKFAQREVKRGVKYEGVIMDPPVYGHNPKGGNWDFNRDFPLLLKEVRQLLSPTPLFLIINAYAISSSSLMLENTINDHFNNLKGNLEVGELAIKEKEGKRLLSTGIFGKVDF